MNKQTIDFYSTLRSILNNKGSLWKSFTGVTNKKKLKQKQLFKKLSMFSFLSKANELQLKCDRNLQIYQKKWKINSSYILYAVRNKIGMESILKCEMCRPAKRENVLFSSHWAGILFPVRSVYKLWLPLKMPLLIQLSHNNSLTDIYS